VVRLGDGTRESKARMEEAISSVWMYTPELFNLPSLASLKDEWLRRIGGTLREAGLSVPDGPPYAISGSERGIHTEHLGYLLAEMQFLQRAYPRCAW
jgi:ring-1,2-phenylacetyl-CoA epoxidase subunit PaaC